jgi:iron complex transport system substrate-binding protein
MRVISLLPSATETVATLGRSSWLVGRSEECDFPPEVAALPIVMRARSLDRDHSSSEIDARVRETRAKQQSLYELDLDLLQGLHPDLLLTQDLCSVCSVTEEEVADACRRSGISPRIVSLSPTRLDDVWENIRTVSEALGDPSAGDRLLHALRPIKPADGTGSKVAVVEWLDPPILAGLWTPDIIEQAGGVPVLGRAGEPGIRTDWERLGQEEIDLLILSPCSFDVPRTRRELNDPRIAASVGQIRPPLGTWLADEAYFSRPGPRLAEGIRLVRELVHRSAPTAPMPVERWSPSEVLLGAVP